MGPRKVFRVMAMFIILIVEEHTYITIYQIKHYKYVVYFVNYASTNLCLKYCSFTQLAWLSG